MQRPTACLTSCPLLPYLTAPDEVAYLIWTHDLIDVDHGGDLVVGVEEVRPEPVDRGPRTPPGAPHQLEA